MHRRLLWSLNLAVGLVALLLAALKLHARSAPQTALAAPSVKIAHQVWEATTGDSEAEFLVVLAEQADLSAAARLPSREARLRYVYNTLRETAVRTQAPLRAELDAAVVAYRSFYIANVLVVKGDRTLVTRLAARPEVARIVANPQIRQRLPETRRDLARLLAPRGIEWGVARVNADDVWALGYTGQSIVVAGQDTGYDWDHPALINQYRGWNGVTATHDYNWHDAIHVGGSDCGADSPVPCDDNSHGTHTMGTIVGDDGGSNQIGVAPGAQWIGCRNMNEGVGTPATYIECFEFFLAPYPLGGNPITDGVPSLAPHVVNNSWTCPSSEGCTWDTLQTVVETMRAAGIVVVASAGNSGSSCGTVNEPIAIYDASFSVGATDSGDNIAGFSSRGPVTVDGSNRLKPDVAAPGVAVRSSLPGGGYGGKQGTSMAGPHVAGTVALLYSAIPDLIGDVDVTEWIITHTARPRTTTQGCGGDSPTDVPNRVYGWGIVDALAAVEHTLGGLEISKQAVFPIESPAQRLIYTINLTNSFTFTLNQVVLTDTVPISTIFAWASGVYTHTGGVVTWTAESLARRETLTATMVVTVAHLPRGTRVINAEYGVRATELVTPVMGVPVEAVVPWRVLLPLVFRNDTPESGDGG
jgi:uncharacterized repeat protein (TIGR01451 family)